MKETYGISRIVMSWKHQDESGKYLPFGIEQQVDFGVTRPKDGHYPFNVCDLAQVVLDLEKKEAVISNTTKYDGTYNVGRANEEYHNLSNNRSLSKVVVITAEKEGVPFELICGSKINGNYEQFFESIDPRFEKGTIRKLLE